MFKMSPASLQTFIYTPNCVLEYRVQYSTVHIPNTFYDGHLQIISLWRLFEYTEFFTAQTLFDHPVHPCEFTDFAPKRP
jgi:hypothetical protein